MIRVGREEIVFIIALGAAQLGCGQSTTSPRVTEVMPERAYTDRAVFLQIKAGTIRPALRVDVSGGGLAADVSSMKATLIPEGIDGLEPARLEPVEWDGGDFSLWVRTPPRLAAARYSLELVDQHGQSSQFPDAFESLGLDPAPPTIDVPSLRATPYVPAGKISSIAIVADDGIGAVATIHWSTSDGDTGDCPPIPKIDAPINIRHWAPSRLTCLAIFKANDLGDDEPTMVPLSFFVTAQDTSGQESTLEVPLQRAKVPTIESFSGTEGSLGGYQPFAVRGRFFIPGTQALIAGVPIVGASAGGEGQDEHSILGWTPPHGRAEPVVVEIRSPAGSAFGENPFMYIEPPRPREIQPSVGPMRGGIRVTVRGNDLRPGVVVYVGATRDTRQPIYNVIPRANVAADAQNKVVGCLPPGMGTVSIWAYDPIAGDGEFPMAFTYQDGGGTTPTTDPECQAPTP